jgi:hypothetical protein
VKTNKFTYLHVVQGDYGAGHGWEDVSQSENRKDMLSDLRAYRQAAPEYSYRIIRRRELKED